MLMEIVIDNDKALLIRYALEDYLNSIPTNADYSKDKKLEEAKIVIDLIKEFEKVEDFKTISNLIIRESNDK